MTTIERGPRMYLGIEIGGTKLQLGLGRGDGQLLALWRGAVDPAAGGPGIRRQIEAAIPELLTNATADRAALRGIGVGFGGPTDDATQTVVKSHHIAGWDGFPLAAWLTEMTGLPAVICNDADTAGLAEALFGAGRGLSPVFYITVGSGIGGGLVIDGEIYRGCGRGAAEVGHLRPVYPLTYTPHDDILEHFASGWGIGRAAGSTGKAVADAAARGDPAALAVLDQAVQALAEGICSVIKLLCPRRVIIGGGVSLIGEDLFFRPLRRYVAERGMAALAGLTEIVPAALGEEVVVHGALALARRKIGG
jgi:glucokinase